MRASVTLAVPGLLLSGFLAALLGLLLPFLSHDLGEQNTRAAWLFGCVGLGILLPYLLRQKVANVAPRVLFRAGSLAASLALLVITEVEPIRFPWNLGAWTMLGTSVGLLQGAVSRSGPPKRFEHGTLFCAGSLAATVCIAALTRWGLVPQFLPALAVVPVGFSLFRFQTSSPVAETVLSPLPRFTALISAALHVFQSGSEWTVAGWLPLFLMRRVGFSPESSLWVLALFWMSLLAGQALNSPVTVRLPQWRFLLLSSSAALVGCGFLALTGNVMGSLLAILLLGFGLGAIRRSDSLPTMPPFVAGGGMLFPLIAGFVAQLYGLNAILLVPAFGVIVVTTLLLVLWLESKVTGRP